MISNTLHHRTNSLNYSRLEFSGIYIYIYIHIERERERERKRESVPGECANFGRMFLTLKYTDITQNTYVYPKLNIYGDNGERSLKV